MLQLGEFYRDGDYGLRQDYGKAFELMHKAGELGSTEAYSNIGYAYNYGQGVERDAEKGKRYNELAAIGGDVYARHNLGNNEYNARNMERALKHYMIAASFGYPESLKMIRELHSNGHAMKEDYTQALLAYQAHVSKIKSAQRDKAAAAKGDRYY